MSERSRWVSALAGGGLLVAGLSAPLPGIEPLTQRAVGLALFAAVMWTVQPVPIEYSSLIILVLLPAMDLLSFQESFTPFARQTIWLVFAGMTLSMAITRSGLGERLALLVLRHTGTSTLRIIATLNLLGLLLAFLVPSGVVRILFLMPIGLAVADRLREAGEDSGMADVVVTLSLLCSTYYGGCGVLTGSVPNLVVAGQLEAAGRLVYWGEWLQWMFPVIGLARTCLCFAVIWLLFGRRMVSRVSRPGGDSKPSSPAAPLNLTHEQHPENKDDGDRKQDGKDDLGKERVFLFDAVVGDVFVGGFEDFARLAIRDIFGHVVLFLGCGGVLALPEFALDHAPVVDGLGD